MAGSSEQRPIVAAFDECRYGLQAEGSLVDVSMRPGKSTIWCVVQEDCIRLLQHNLDHISSTTNTDISLTHGHAGFVKLFISGRVPDIYSAHFQLMWCVHWDEQRFTGSAGAIRNTIPQLAAMQPWKPNN